MIADIASRLADLRESLTRLTPRPDAVNGVCVPAADLDKAHDAARDVLRDVVAACPNPAGRSEASDDRLTWGLERCGDAQGCALERITMDIAFVVGSLDRVEQDPAWVSAYLPQAVGRLDGILAEWSRLERDLPDPAVPASCPGARARALRSAGS